jgi:hypothetical protein
MIVKYLSELLFERECVIVPEFGAFISKETPATIDYASHRLTPPSKEVVFNSQLIADDGVLVDYFSVKMDVSHEEAAKMVHDFAMRSLAVLDCNEPLHLEGIGTLERINSKDFTLRLDDDVNLLGDAFGLTSFSVQPIYRSETYQHIATKIAAEQKAKNTAMTVHGEEKPHHVNRYNYRWFRAAAYSMMVAMLLVLLGWGADKSDSKIASWNLFFYSSPNEFIAKHLNARFEAMEKINVERIPVTKVSLPTFGAKDINYLQPLDNESLKPVDPNYYYIIGGSFKNNKDARRCANGFKKQGFDNVEVLQANKKGNVRVAYEVVMGKEAALKRLEIIKKEYNEAAWLLRKK